MLLGTVSPKTIVDMTFPAARLDVDKGVRAQVSVICLYSFTSKSKTCFALKVIET